MYERIKHMKIKDGYILKKVMGSYMIVSTHETELGVSRMQTINETGAFLWDCLTEESTLESLTERLLSEYDIDFDTAKHDVAAFTEKLRQNNLLDD